MKLSLDTLPLYCTQEGDCLLWNLGCNSQDKPQARLEGKYFLVQRYVYTRLMGLEIPEGRRITTRCGHFKCIAPGCLIASTYGEILKRSWTKSRRTRVVAALSRRTDLEKCWGARA